MKRIFCTVLIAAAAFLLGACEPAKPTNNTSNSNTSNTSNANAKPVAAAPKMETLIDMDKKANEAFVNGDSAHFESMLGDKFVSFESGMRMSKADIVKMVGGTKCDVKTWSIDEPQMHQIDADTYATIYKGTFDGTCGGEKIPSPTRAMSVWARNGDKWVGVFHSETLISDPKSPPKAAPPPPGEKKDEAKPAPDPNLDALLAVERSGWEAWKARDGKKLEEITMKTLGFIGVFGNYTENQADTIKAWTGGQCDIKGFELANASAATLSPTVAILDFKGTADGTCDGQKLLPLWGTNIYVKDGGNWKLAAGIERPAA